MREIRFRAWDKKRQHMHTSFRYENICGTQFVGGLIYPEVFQQDVSFEVSEDEWAVMQFTGLRDKNGNEIYEGDIVAWSEDIYAHGEYLGQEHNKSEVAYGGSSFWVLPSVRLDDTDDGDGIACEVIGNVHEHPELLQSSTQPPAETQPTDRDGK